MTYTQNFLDSLLNRRDRWAPFVLSEVNWSDAASRYRRYEHSNYVDLPHQGKRSLGPLDYQVDSHDEVTLEDVATILHWSMGVAGYKLSPNWEDVSQKSVNASLLQRRHRFTLPSGGGMYPHEIFLIANNIPTLPPGVYHYQNSTHRLARIRAGRFDQTLESACFGACGPGAFSLIISMNYWKNYYKYRAFTYHIVGSDTGVVTASMMQLAKQLGLQPHLITRFDDAEIQSLLCMEEEKDAPFAVLHFGDRGTCSDDRQLQSWQAQDKSLEPFSRWVFFNPFIARLEKDSQHITELEGSAPEQPSFPDAWVKQYELPETPSSDSPPVEEILRARASGFGRLCLRRKMTQEELAQILRATCDRLVYDANPEGISHVFPVVYAKNVDGLEPAIYAYREVENALYLIKKSLNEILLQEAYNLTNVNLLQAQLVVFLCADYQPMLAQYGPRGYRMLNMELGYMVQRHYLGVGRHKDLCTHALFGLEPQEARELLGLGETSYFPLVTLTTGTPRKPCHFQYRLL